MRITFEATLHSSWNQQGYLVVRQLGQLEMRQSRLSMHWSMPMLGSPATSAQRSWSRRSVQVSVRFEGDGQGRQT